MDQLQQVMLERRAVSSRSPTEVDWFQYNTSQFTGWPTQANPYALPAPYVYPDMGQVLLHLAPK